MVRGTDRQNIFLSDADRNDLLSRLGKGVLGSDLRIYAWALMSNHLLLRSGSEGLSTTMRRLLTGYTVRFNRRHRRWGHLFQNRYKSILVEMDSYLLELVRYIHLNRGSIGGLGPTKLGRLLHVSMPSVWRGVQIGEHLMIKNRWELNSFWS